MDRKITYDPDEVMRFLTYARILEPDSKLGTYDHLDRYYEEPSFGYEHILRTMDILAENYDGYLKSLYQNSLSVVKGTLVSAITTARTITLRRNHRTRTMLMK